MRNCLVLFCLLTLVTGCGRRASDDVADDPYSVPVSEWVNVLRSGDDERRLIAVWALGERRQEAKEALPDLILLLKHENPMMREQVLKSLVQIDPKAQETQPHLSAATRDNIAGVRLEAAKALGKVGPPAWPAVVELESLLDDDYVEVRRAAVQALGFIGPGAVKARPKLVELLEDDYEDEVVRSLAKNSIDLIDNKW